MHLGHSTLQKLVKETSFMDASNQWLKCLFDAVCMTHCQMNIGKITCMLLNAMESDFWFV